MKKAALLLVAVLLVAGCATSSEVPMEPKAADGSSRAAGIVVMAYEHGRYGRNVKLVVDWEGTLKEAAAICFGWNYRSARRLSVSASCTLRDEYGTCHRRVVSIRYQCQDREQVP